MVAMQGRARADAVVAESGSDRRIKCLLARVTGIPVLKRSFLDRSLFSASTLKRADTAHAWRVIHFMKACLMAS